MTDLISTYEVRDERIYVKTPYADEIVSQCRAWGGKFQQGCWVLPLTRLEAVQEKLGADQSVCVEAEIDKTQLDEKGAQYLLGWYVVASRRGRDSRADLYADLVAGEVPASGGSMKHPRVAADNDARFRLWVAKDFAIARQLTIVTESPATGPLADDPSRANLPTLPQLAQQAIDVQDASNIIGVSRSFGEALPQLSRALAAAGKPNYTDAIAQHPVTQLWLTKLYELAYGSGRLDTIECGVAAYQACRKLAQGES